MVGHQPVTPIVFVRLWGGGGVFRHRSVTPIVIVRFFSSPSSQRLYTKTHICKLHMNLKLGMNLELNT